MEFSSLADTRGSGLGFWRECSAQNLGAGKTQASEREGKAESAEHELTTAVHTV